MIAESGSDLAATLWGSRHRAASSVLVYPEGRAALGAGQRGGRISRVAHQESVEQLRSAYGELFLVGMDAQLALDAGELADRLGLRGSDAVHLASARALGPDTTMVTWDRDLGAAAHESGLAVAPAREELLGLG